MIYRREIDGLRALAVIPVILFHAGFSLFSGGFVGVDVFFVISGYLITSILIEDIEQQRFSLWRFYERRARRLLPALFFVLLVCLPFAWQWMLAEQLKDFFASLFTVATFLSNLYFLTQINYFSPSAELQPLLHTWSLAVEEQYYLFFPPLLYLLFRLFQRKSVWLIVLLTVFSLLLAQWLSGLNAERNFFFTLSRFWEIGVGSIATFVVRRYGVRSNNSLALLGFLAIVVAIFTFDKATPFPSIYTLLPVLGVFLLVVYGGAETVVARWLSWPPVVFVGLISYSAYLWHHPLYAFARLRSIYEPQWWVMLGLVVATLIMASLSWRFVEQPFRGKKPWLSNRRQLFSVSLLGLSVFAAVGLWGYKTGGFPNRLPEHVAYIEKGIPALGRTCPDEGVSPCVIGKKGDPKVALFGDSHAAAYAGGFDPVLKNAGVSMWLANGGCAPLLNYYKRHATERDTVCANTMTQALHGVAENDRVTKVILAAQWGYYVYGWRYSSRQYIYTYDAGNNTVADNNPIEFEKAFKATIEMLLNAGKEVVIVKALPEYDFDVAEALAKSVWRNQDPAQLTSPYNSYVERNKDFEYMLQDSALNSVNVVEIASYFCDQYLCKPYSEDTLPYYHDSNHLNQLGLKKVAESVLLDSGLLTK